VAEMADAGALTGPDERVVDGAPPGCGAERASPHPEPAAGEAEPGPCLPSEIVERLARREIFEDPELASLRSRALAYLRAGVAVHFRGRAGMGKTSMALRLAGDLGRPVALVTGDQGLSARDLVGRELGSERKMLQDSYVQRVKKLHETTRAAWCDGVLTESMEKGHTLVYDEFTRSSPDTNNILLSVLEERLLVVPSPVRRERYVHAHPEFRIIFTSNPEEYAGVTAAPDALFDRMITLDVSWLSLETEAGIVAARTGLAVGEARETVALLRALRDVIPGENPPSLRTAITMGRIMAMLGVRADRSDERFVQICLDVLEARAPGRGVTDERERYIETLRARLRKAMSRPGGMAPARGGVSEVLS